MAKLMAMLEVAGHVTLIWVFLLALLRLGGRRELAQMTPMEMLTMLLLSEAVSPALTAGHQDLAAGLVAATTLIALTVLLGYVTYRSRRLHTMIAGNAAILVRDGRVDPDVMRHQRLSDQDLRTALHGQGLLRVDQVAVAFVEPSGQITIVKKPDADRHLQS